MFLSCPFNSLLTSSHDLDLVCWTLNMFPKKVYCVGVAHDEVVKSLDDYDSIDCSLIFDNDILGSVDVTRYAVYGYGKFLFVIWLFFLIFRSTTRSSWRCWYCQHQQHVTGILFCVGIFSDSETSFVLGKRDGFHHDAGLYSFPQRYREAYAIELDHFVDLCLGVTDKIAYTAEVCFA